MKKCRDCKDRFCDSCFISIHRKGARKTHSWESIVANHFDNTQGTSRKGNNSNNNNNISEEKAPPNKEKGGAEKGKAKEWQKFYDDAAKAYYWYNAKSGEAKWTEP